ncbi:MAG: hypothetical protein IJ555_07705 [Ruminococcus sp.]|nr:hypothetical protein [Ruminococcus sp.]
MFQEIYRITERIMEYSGDRMFIMLCTIVDGKGKPMNGGTRLEDLSARLKDAILNSVRYSDTVTRYGKGQFLVLMIDTTKEGCETVEKRINSKFMKNGQRTGVSYSVSNVIVPAFSEELNII